MKPSGPKLYYFHLINKKGSKSKDVDYWPRRSKDIKGQVLTLLHTVLFDEDITISFWGLSNVHQSSNIKSVSKCLLDASYGITLLREAINVYDEIY